MWQGMLRGNLQTLISFSHQMLSCIQAQVNLLMYFCILLSITLLIWFTGTIPDFLDMIRRDPPVLKDKSKKRIFANAIFEIEASAEKVPETKYELVTFLRKGIAIPFHHYICPMCHKQPGAKEWMEDSLNSTGRGFLLSLFSTLYAELTFVCSQD